MVVPLSTDLAACAGRLPAPVQLVWALADDGEAHPRSDRQAFEARMRSAWPGVVRLVERLLAWPGSASEVEDVAQEAFLAAWRKRDEFRGDAEWSTWVHAIALRRARNAARGRERRQRWFGRPAAADLDGLPQSGDAPASADAVTSDRVREALKRMRHADREVLVLRYLEGQSVDAIAAQLTLGRAAVDARLSRARARMRDLLDSAEARR